MKQMLSSMKLRCTGACQKCITTVGWDGRGTGSCVSFQQVKPESGIGVCDDAFMYYDDTHECP